MGGVGWEARGRGGVYSARNDMRLLSGEESIDDATYLPLSDCCQNY